MAESAWFQYPARKGREVEALIDEADPSAWLYGISSGAALALQAAVQLGTKVKKLAMYESLVHCRGHSAVEHKALRPLY